MHAGNQTGTTKPSGIYGGEGRSIVTADEVLSLGTAPSYFGKWAEVLKTVPPKKNVYPWVARLIFIMRCYGFCSLLPLRLLLMPFEPSKGTQQRQTCFLSLGNSIGTAQQRQAHQSRQRIFRLLWAMSRQSARASAAVILTCYAERTNRAGTPKKKNLPNVSIHRVVFVVDSSLFVVLFILHPG